MTSNGERIADLQSEAHYLRHRMELETDAEINILMRELMDKIVARIILLKKGLA